MNAGVMLAPHRVAGVTKLRCRPYLDSFGPNGVVFPCDLCDMGGHLLREGRDQGCYERWSEEGLCRLWNATHMVVWWWRIHRQSCRQWNPNTDLNMQDINTHLHSVHTKPQDIWNQFDMTTPPQLSNHQVCVFKCVFFSITLSILSAATPSDTHSVMHTHTHNNKVFLPERALKPLPCFPMSRYFWMLIWHLRRESATPSAGSLTSAAVKHQHLTDDSSCTDWYCFSKRHSVVKLQLRHACTVFSPPLRQYYNYFIYYSLTE